MVGTQSRFRIQRLEERIAPATVSLTAFRDIAVSIKTTTISQTATATAAAIGVANAATATATNTAIVF
jgi:hypothetical protein